MKIAFHTLGCKLNYAETSTYERGFISHGLEVAGKGDTPDVILVNTCAVTQRSEYKCRNIIRKNHRLFPKAPIVVVGCYAQLRKEEVLSIEGVALVFGAKEKSRVVPDTLSFLRGEGTTVKTSSPEARTLAQSYKDISEETLAAYSSGERTRSFLKVQDGCNNFCAYCTVPYARGESRNPSIGTIVAQAGEIARKGVKEIVLTGVNTGDFGRSTGETFLDLLRALNEVEGIERYRISSIEPNLLTEEIIDWIGSGTKFLPHFHIPLQSGSDTMLRKVGRKYDTALFASRIDYIRKVLEGPGKPMVFLGIDTIVGLPGETEELFMETYDFLERRIRPAFIHIFPYSPRPGTRAALMPDQVTNRVKEERVARLEDLCRRLHDEFVQMNTGLEEEVLWEDSNHDGIMEGYTGNYIRIAAPYDPTRTGTIEKITIKH